MACQPMAQRTELWPIDKLVFYARNPRKNDSAVDHMCSSIRETLTGSEATLDGDGRTFEEIARERSKESE